MSRSRPKSASSGTCTHGKPLMQTKYRPRTGGRSALDDSAQMNQSLMLPEPPKAKEKDKESIKLDSKKKRSNSVIIEPSHTG